MMNKIQVLLIDDLPKFALEYAEETTLTDIKVAQKEREVPFIAVKPYSDFFELKWIQKKEDLLLYKKLCRVIEDRFSATGLGSVEGAVPEIVLFDYALTGHEDANYLSEENDKNILAQLVPNYKLAQYWQKHQNETDLPTVDKIKINSTQISEGLNDDNIGCIGGIIAVTQFRVHPCIGVATSRKTDANIQGRDVQFLEALVKEPNQFNFSLRGDALSNLNWKTLLSSAALLLRQRIESLLQSNKITLNLTQLLVYKDKIPEELKNRIFTFQSAYGLRHLPLDGLFIDVEKNERDLAIIKWVSTLLNNFNSVAYKTAMDTSTKLIKAYQSIPVVKNRIRLSELAVKLCNSETLDFTEKNEIEKLKTEFGINDTQIVNCIKNGDAENSNLAYKVIEYRKDKTNDNETNRLIVLFTELQVHRVWQNFCEMNKNAALDGQISTFLKSPPTLDDLRAALFPIPMNPLVLPYHYHLLWDKSKFKSKDPFDIWDKHIGRDMKDDKGIFYKTEYPKNISSGEKQLSANFALDIGLNCNYYPRWLK